MKKEIEIKILNIDRKKLRLALKKLGATQIKKPTLFREIYWKSPTKERQYSSFRLRSEGEKHFLTLKLKIDDEKFGIHNEHETEVSDFDTTKKILQLAGFKIFRNREKIREEYLWRKTKIELDEYPEMNPYIEIEASSKKDIEIFLNRIGFPIKHTTKETATEIIKKAGLNPDYLFFK